MERMLGCQPVKEFAGDRSEGLQVTLVEVPGQGFP
jgi:hypothetical protein